MFQGVVHANARKIIARYIERLPRNVHIIGSGNFSIETTLRANGYRGTITGCDISLYSCVLGTYLAGGNISVVLNSIEFPELMALESHLGDSEGNAAAVAVALQTLRFRKRDNHYKRRMYNAHIRRLDALCEETRHKLRQKHLVVRLDDFHALDGWQRVAEIPSGDDHAIVTFPPTYSGGYERLYAELERAFHWERPEYQDLSDIAEIARGVAARSGPWIIGTEQPTAELEREVGEPIALSPRGSAVNISLYSNIPTLNAQLIRRRVNTQKRNWVRLTESDTIDESSLLSVHAISKPEANHIRAVYGSVDIQQSDAPFCYAVAVDGNLLGLLMFAPDVRPRPPQVDVGDREGVYLMCDLAVSSERYHRLGKLILMVARSEEMRRELENRLVRRLTWAVTTAFSRYPESMKYRGVFRRFSRVRLENGMYKLNYFSRLGEQSLREVLREWIRRFRTDSTDGLPKSHSCCLEKRRN
ncbi:MAG: hypothetical protein HON53_22980 [Planctomycetaceae bacterium]|jgi:hypothetical protein|nr:hypothetical protein [Planctomycetaceae bacterium]MBT6155295.1 hypothetical protein [Planctomycetaceae bacterium]MBT6485209.1 hypothetical protein [Planctomycetaceae bacterium]MBT6497106.1 hypothetical protein [Planctomycetaceae bacterium]